jgi:cysteine desulfurase/selenocysteine lyase
MPATLAPHDLRALRSRFPLIASGAGGGTLAYLDNAATTQKPDSVIGAEVEYYRTLNANVHRGLYELARRSTEAYESAREAARRFINAPHAHEIVFVRGATEAVNTVAGAWGGANLRAGDEIVLAITEHHSNIVPWQLVAQRTGARLRWADIDEEGRLLMEPLQALLSERTRVVAIGHVSNSIGTIHPVREICRLARAAGAISVIDGAQAAPHLPIDVQELGCDFYALSGHKMGGPMGIGVLWGRFALLEAMPPWQGGGEMIDTVGPDASTWAELPHKFEAGTPNVAGAAGLEAAIRFLEALGADNLMAQERELTGYGIERLSAVGGLRLFGPPTPDDRVSLFAFTMDGIHPHDVATILDAHGVAVRAGHHCTQPLMRRLGVPATTRASAWVYNTFEEIDRLVDGLEDARRIFGS